MSAIVVDTCAFVDFFRGKDSNELQSALDEGRVWLSPIVTAELLSAPLKIDKRVELVEFLNCLPLAETDFLHWSRVGDLRANLTKKGIAISTPDAHVAQCAIDLQANLMTSDKIFSKIKKLTGLKIIGL